MSLSINHPSILKFLSEVTNNIVSSISIDNYFSTSQESKIALSYAVYKIIKSNVDNMTTMGEPEFKVLLIALWKKNEESENYEVAAILNDIIKNYDAIKEICKPPVRITRKLKIDKKSNDQ